MFLFSFVDALPMDFFLFSSFYTQIQKLLFFDFFCIFRKIFAQGALLLSREPREIDRQRRANVATTFPNAADAAFALIGEAIGKDSVSGILPEGVRVNPVFKRNIK